MGRFIKCKSHTLGMLDELKLVKELSESDKEVESQFRTYNSITNKCRKTFFNKRRLLGLKSITTNFNYNGYEGKLCYFCLMKAMDIHHIDLNRQNNSSENLIPLCRSCHNKVHRIYKRLNVGVKV